MTPTEKALDQLRRAEIAARKAQAARDKAQDRWEAAMQKLQPQDRPRYRFEDVLA